VPVRVAELGEATLPSGVTPGGGAPGLGELRLAPVGKKDRDPHGYGF
jgi:hypothetical protein